MTTERLALELRATVDNSFGSQYWHGLALPVRITDDSQLRGVSDDYSGRRVLECLEIRAQLDRGYAAEGKGSYGWSIEYRQPFSVSLHDAERMTATLRGVAVKLAKLDDKYGPPATFGAYVARVGDALGINEFVIPRSPEADVRMGDSWRVGNAADAVAWLDGQEHAYRVSQTAAVA